MKIVVETEPLFTDGEHDVFFNRGVASSQAYQRRFGNVAPDKLETQEKQAEALQWLSRDLDEAMIRFIDQAEAGDTLLGCFYEFRYLPVALRLKAALERGVKVQLILDSKENSRTDKDGKFHESFPKVENQKTVKAAKIPAKAIACWRQNNRSNIQHNKFLVLLRAAPGDRPDEVWTGSTNLSNGGVHGQTNVGHWVGNAAVAADFAAYWTLLKDDPGAVDGETAAQSKKRRGDYRKAVMDLRVVPTRWADIAVGVTSIFSPRAGSAVLDMYVDALDKSSISGGVTLAFGIGKAFKEALVDNIAAPGITPPILFLLLEKKDKPNPKSKTPFIPLTAKHNVYKAWGSYLRDPVYQWARETNARMLAIRGNERVADIYFTEFNRLFNHYYFRSVRESLFNKAPKEANGAADTSASLFLDETGKWLEKYEPGDLRRKRVEVYTQMANARTL